MQEAEARALGAMPYGPEGLYSALTPGMPTCTRGSLVVSLPWQEDEVDSVFPLGRQL